MSHARVVWGAVLLVAAHAAAAASEAPPAVSCNANPVASVPPFSSFNVTEEPAFLSSVGSKCLKPLTDVDKAIEAVIGLDKPDPVAAGRAAKDLGSKALALRNAVIAIAGGAELYVANCLTGAAKDYVVQAYTPQALLDAQTLYNSAKATKEKAEKAYKDVQDKQARGERVTPADLAQLQGLVQQLTPEAKTVSAARSLWQGAQALYERPEKLLDLESELGITADRAADLITKVTSTCDLGRAEAELKAATERGQEGLTAARLAAARARKQYNRTGELLDRQCGTAWRRSALAMIDCRSPLFPEYANYTAELQQAEQREKAVESLLVRIGGLCPQLVTQAGAVEQRLAQYQSLGRTVQADVARCSQDAARRGLRSLANLASSECGPYLARSSPEDLRPDALERRLATCSAQATPSPSPQAGPIRVLAGTYGGNCADHAGGKYRGAVQRGNRTDPLAKECNGQAKCLYRVDYRVIGDPADGCAKDFVAEWQCGNDPTIRKDVVEAEAGRGKSAYLRCE